MNSPQDRFTSVLREAQAWNLSTEPFEVLHVFTQGLSHHTAHIGHQSADYVLKLLTDTPEQNQRSIHLQQWAAEHKLAPTIHFHDANFRYFVCDYLTPFGFASHPNTSLNSTSIDALAAALTRLHQLEVQPNWGPFELADFCSGYVERAGDWAIQQHTKMQPVLATFDQLPKTALCHNDLVAANIHIDTQVQFIDWEYGQVNTPLFDIAAICFYCQLNSVQTQQLFTHCLGHQPLAADWAQLELSIAALLWGDILWHLKQFGEGIMNPLSNKIKWMLDRGFIDEPPPTQNESS